MILNKIKKIVNSNKILSTLARPINYFLTRKKDFSSKKYWEKRYLKGGNSGDGSYGNLALFKAEIINDFIRKNKIDSVIEFGCGDGNQLSLLKVLRYIGLDVSKKSIQLCKEKFLKDEKKSFFIYDPESFVDKFEIFSADLTLSLDVIYHLIEDEIFEKYIDDLFKSSKKFVIIYSDDTDEQEKYQSQHVRHRKFSRFIEKNYKSWKLISKIKNKYPIKENQGEGSFADFYVYKKVN